MSRVDYDRVAPRYDERYRHGGPTGVAETLHRIVAGCERVLEVGCGTGHWLAELAPAVRLVCGLDRSLGMLAKAKSNASNLAQGDAGALPYRASSFGAVYCVNAFHHFGAPRDFLAEAFRLLRPGGAIAVIGMDPNALRDRWYLYDFFPGMLETDRRRFPSSSQIAAWMREVGFAGIAAGEAARIQGEAEGKGVYADVILSRTGTSQCTLLSDAEFDAGMARIAAAADAGQRFVTDIALNVVEARRA